MPRFSLACAAALALCSCSKPATPTTLPDQVVDFDHEREASIAPRPPAPEGDSYSGFVTTCSPKTDEYEDAQDVLHALDQLVEGLEPDADPTPFNEALEDLLRHPCFELALLDVQELPKVTSAVAAAEYWDRGAHYWLESYLDLHRSGASAHFPPSVRQALTKETNPDHPLRKWLCSARDDSCGGLADAWASRATLAFDRWVTGNPNHYELDEKTDKCGTDAMQAPAGRRYAKWRECVDGLRVRRRALPLGGLGVVDEGWLVVRGRRGHYSFCDEVRAYDLDTGAAYVASSCSGLQLQSGGSVDHKATDDQREDLVKVGTLPINYLREAAWMMLSIEASQEEVLLTGERHPLPLGVVAARTPDDEYGIALGDYGWSSAQTTLSFTYVHDAKALARGAITWPSDYNDPALDHAVKLLQIAEAGFEPRCAPARMPKKLAAQALAPGVSHIDADPTRLRSTQGKLIDALQAQARRGKCPRP